MIFHTSEMRLINYIFQYYRQKKLPTILTKLKKLTSSNLTIKFGRENHNDHELMNL